MKKSCIFIAILVTVALIVVCFMVKFATDITVTEKQLDMSPRKQVPVLRQPKGMGVISLGDLGSFSAANSFPSVGAIIRNSSSSWMFACFASVILNNWIVTSAHCHEATASSRLILYHDIIRNFTYTYSVVLWRVHEKFDSVKLSAKYDIAVAKLDLNLHSFVFKPATFDSSPARSIKAAVWKTVSTMDNIAFLTNAFEIFDLRIVTPSNCLESYGMPLDDSMFCVDMSDYKQDCFVQEFGPIFSNQRVVGLLAMKPKDCDMRNAIFTNVSYYSTWIQTSTSAATYRAYEIT